MSSINPKNLRTLRDQKGWSLDDLSARAKVDRGTISRIETGRQLGRRRNTVESLAKALEVDPAVLTGPDLQSPASKEESALSSTLNVRLGNDARNALSLVALRYGVKPADIVDLAPLLFLWAAEESLRRRSQNLDELESRLSAIEASSSFEHLSSILTHNWRGDEIISQERRSIAKRDIFALTIDDDDALPPDYDEGEHNPMAIFLRDLIAPLEGLAEFERWAPRWHRPGYSLGRELAAALAGGDEQAADYIVSGYAPLHELPKSVREEGPSAVAAWATIRGNEFLDKLVGDMDFEI